MSNIMTREEFKARWESGDDGGGITIDDCADCATEWGLMEAPRTMPMETVISAVLAHAGIEDN